MFEEDTKEATTKEEDAIEEDAIEDVGGCSIDGGGSCSVKGGEDGDRTGDGGAYIGGASTCTKVWFT